MSVYQLGSVRAFSFHARRQQLLCYHSVTELWPVGTRHCMAISCP